MFYRKWKISIFAPNLDASNFVAVDACSDIVCVTFFRRRLRGPETSTKITGRIANPALFLTWPEDDNENVKVVKNVSNVRSCNRVTQPMKNPFRLPGKVN